MTAVTVLVNPAGWETISGPVEFITNEKIRELAQQWAASNGDTLEDLAGQGITVADIADLLGLPWHAGEVTV